MPNVKSKLDQHNRSELGKQEQREPPKCNCRDKNKCPLNSKCQESGIVYQATVKEKGNGNTETYVGLTETSFKLRYANHKQTFENQKLQTKTELSKHIWSLKKQNREFDISWKILAKTRPYSNETKNAKLYTKEKYIIMFQPGLASRNQRGGVIASCLQENSSLQIVCVCVCV